MIGLIVALAAIALFVLAMIVAMLGFLWLVLKLTARAAVAAFVWWAER